MKSKGFRIVISSISIMIALFLVGYVVYKIVGISCSADDGNSQSPSIPNSSEEKLFEVSFESGLYEIEGNVITLTNPNLPVTTLSLAFTYLMDSNKTQEFCFEIVFEPNIDFTLKDTKVSFKYTEDCIM
ncbi:MAG: hypothetical protein K2K31_01465, partial [Clostridia bacterium]|nr:hypothetical protein [Clostridia bacterium]